MESGIRLSVIDDEGPDDDDDLNLAGGRFPAFSGDKTVEKAVSAGFGGYLRFRTPKSDGAYL